MNFETIKQVATSKAAVAIFKGKKYSPQILFAAGAVGMFGTVVLACRATLKISDRLTDAELTKQVIDGKVTRGDIDEDTQHRLMTKVKIDLAGDLAKTFALPAVLGLVSLGCLGGAHYILNKRNGVLLASYAALDRAYAGYRKNVVDEYGEEKDLEFALGVTKREVTEKLADGTEKVSLEKVAPAKRANGMSPYAVCFDEQSRFWTKEPGMNEHILEIKKSQANDKLMQVGHITLNEVYDFLGLPHTNAGFLVGWIYDPHNLRKDAAEVKRDNYVSFNMWKGDPERVEAFLQGYEKSIWLDFNVDGVIYDRI